MQQYIVQAYDYNASHIEKDKTFRWQPVEIGLTYAQALELVRTIKISKPQERLRIKPQGVAA